MAKREALQGQGINHAGYSQGKPRKAKLPPVPFCTRCRRPDSQPHAGWCDGTPVPPPETPGPSPVVIKRTAPTASATDVIEFRQVLQSPADRHTERAKEQRAAAMATVARRRAAAVADAKPRTPEPVQPQQPEPIEATPVADHNDQEETPMASSIAEALTNAGLTTLPQPEADRPVKLCKRCERADVEFGRNGSGPYCKGCRRDMLASGRRAAPTKPLPEAPSARNSRGNDAGRVDHRQPKNEGLPGGPSSPSEMTLAELESERSRVAAYLVELDERIETAKALEALAQYPEEALRDMLALATKQARQIELALQVRAG